MTIDEAIKICNTMIFAASLSNPQGTPLSMTKEELTEAMGMAIKALEEVQQYCQIGTVEECRAAMEKQTAIPREIIEGKYFCPKCHNLAPYPMYCGCGQKLY